MQKTISLKLLPSETASEAAISNAIAQTVGVPSSDVSGYHILKRSIDARGRQAWFNLSVQAFIQEPFHDRPIIPFHFKDVHDSPHQVVIIGAGPAGLFAALKLIESGIRPVLLERGKDVRARRRDLARLNKQGIVDPDSNYCFGEGGAGTYSDGKLYTRSSKRGDINRILNLFVHFGAEPPVLYDAHPHIGTNKLPHIITAMRRQIIAAGGQYHFDKKVTDLRLADGALRSVVCSDGSTFNGEAVILATGHSARDIFELLHRKGIRIEPKPFALGARVEHPQSLIDTAQYHCAVRGDYLPPASYSLVQQVGGNGVFSFCMCPGGIIAPAATAPGELVVNGWSPSKRNNPFANSGIVVTVQEKDLQQVPARNFEQVCQQPASVLAGPLGMMYFQQYVERKAFTAGGGHFVAPAQRLIDFTQRRLSASLPDCSYLPGIHSSRLSEVLPGFIDDSLRAAFLAFGKKMNGYLTNEAVLVATESRTSSPVRIPREPQSLEHPSIKGLYPCAEGAGYAGGIVSAAMDGERVAAQIALLVGL